MRRPAPHGVNELEALRLRSSSGVVLADDLAEDLDRLAQHDDPRVDWVFQRMRPPTRSRRWRWHGRRGGSGTRTTRAPRPTAPWTAALVRDSLVATWQEVTT